ncbi:DNA repair protein XRCC3 isoform X2 [Ovis aries]|uniref:DNA repair protein XRCC3 isoform X2 n=1 Tax=Ovis aries TaxID=9940 RepID=UPI001C2E3F22|nr:DNA repair protein XRCC3 isoform X2 [Ovis aries]
MQPWAGGQGELQARWARCPLSFLERLSGHGGSDLPGARRIHHSPSCSLQIPTETRSGGAYARECGVGPAPAPQRVPSSLVVPAEEMDLDRLDLNPRIIAAVKKAKLRSVKEVLHLSGPDLQRRTHLSSPDVRLLLRAAAVLLRGHSMCTALRLLRQEGPFPEQCQRLSLGCPVLDVLLRGGLPLDGITELAGRSSAGKTQLALQLCLAVQLPQCHGGLGAGAVYVCTEDAFPSRRLQQLIAQQQRLRADVPADVISKIKFGHQIFIEHAADVVTEAIEEQDSVAGPPGTSPALGITWANQLLVRLLADRQCPEEVPLVPPGRTLRVVFAPHLPPSSCSYTITAEGVRGTPGTVCS